MAPPWGHRSDMLPHLFFMPCQTRAVTLVTPVPSGWSETVKIVVSVITSELGSPALMAPPPLHSEPVGGNAPLSSVLLALPWTAWIRYPSEVRWPVHRGPVDTEHNAHVTGSPHMVVYHTNQRAPRRAQSVATRSNRGQPSRLCTLALLFS